MSLSLPIVVAIPVLFAICSASLSASVDILEAGEGIEFRDMGLDPETGRITLVGTENGVAKVFYVSEDRQSLTSAVLVGFGDTVIVDGISSDGSRIAGTSNSPEADPFGVGEGTTWLSQNPGSPEGIGFIEGIHRRETVAIGAWARGTVGDHGGIANAVVWSPGDGVKVLEDDGGLAQAVRISADGRLIVGFASGLPCCWFDSEFSLLPLGEPTGGRATSVSPDGRHVGGAVSFLDLEPEFDAGRQALIWTSSRKIKNHFHPRRLVRSGGERFRAEVWGITNSGWAVGGTPPTGPGLGDPAAEQAFIWYPGFDFEGSAWGEPQLLDDWLESLPGGVRPATPSGRAYAILEEPGKLVIAVAVPPRIVFVDKPEIDADGDGLSDSAEGSLGTDPFDADTDGDTYDDGAETELGTDPLDGGSFFQATITGPDPASGGGRELTISWPTRPGNRYTVEASSSPTAGSWQAVYSQTAGAGQTTLTANIPLTPFGSLRMNFRVRFDGVGP
ncbi:MAG: hypothetical protein KDN22_21115 [Verrucomicrobiae bacterium]|nr:hypothetical protein [Verrucomicrobiae bacterium]